MSGWWSVLKETFSEGRADEITRLGASLAYYMLFSLAPLALIAVAVAGQVLGRPQAESAVFHQLKQFMGGAQARAVERLVMNARPRAGGAWPEIAGGAALLFGAYSVVGELQDALNRIFETSSDGATWLEAARQKLVALAFVLGAGFLLFVSMALSTAFSAAGRAIGAFAGVSEAALHAANIAATFVLVSALFTMIFRYLPLARIAWRDAWAGAAVTTALFLVGNAALGLYLAKAGPVSLYGAAGSLLAVLIWSYYGAQIFYLGAEFTRVYAKRRGAGLVRGG